MVDIERKELRQKLFGTKEQGNTPIASSVSLALLKLFPPERLERIKKKELRKYEAAQDKKWRNYLEAVSE